MVLVKPEHENRISHVFSDSVKTGIANTLGKQFHFSTSHVMTCPLKFIEQLPISIDCDVCFIGNKGAVGVSFMFNGTSFGFVNSHLTSGSEKKLRWAADNYNNINISINEIKFDCFAIAVTLDICGFNQRCNIRC